MLLLGFCRTTVDRSPGKRRRSHRETAASSPLFMGQKVTRIGSMSPFSDPGHSDTIG